MWRLSVYDLWVAEYWLDHMFNGLDIDMYHMVPIQLHICYK